MTDEDTVCGFPRVDIMEDSKPVNLGDEKH